MLSMGFERLEPCVGKLASTVLMGVPRSNTGCLPGEDAFYTKHQIDLYNECGVDENIEYDRQLLAEYYKDDMVFSYSADNDKWEQEIDELFWECLKPLDYIL